MRPFGETVLAWRLWRGQTQVELARAARIPRSNLCAIERGDREVTLKTLRALALALRVRPGVLADGEAPGGDARPLSRARLERVARAAGRHQRLKDPEEAQLAQLLATVLGAGSDAAGARRRRGGRRAAERAFLLLKMRTPPETVTSLVERARGHLQRS